MRRDAGDSPYFESPLIFELIIDDNYSATVGHDPQTSNGNQPQQQVQSGGGGGGGGGWTGIPESTLVSRSARNNGNSNSNGWNSVATTLLQQQQQQQLHERKQKEAKSGDLGDDEDGGGGGGGLEGTDPEENNSVHLKRRVGLVSGVALIVGTMIGSGIFVSPSGLLVRTGSIGISFLVWTACGMLSLCGALAYAELGTMNTSSGAEYAYFMDAFGAPPAFLFSWVSTLVLKPSQMAIICLSFAQYAVEAFAADCDPPEEVVKIVALLAIILILLVNCYSVNLATGVQNAFTAAKLIAILVVIAGGSYKLIQGNTQHLKGAFDTMDGNTINIGRLATAFYTGLWAYDGWNNLNYVTEEIKDPSKNLPRSIMIGIPLVTLCYALINVSYLAVMSPSEMIESEAVAVTFGNRILGVMAWLMPLSVAISTFGSANGTLFAAGRLCFAASREGHLLDCLSYVHVRRFTPAPGLIFHSLVAGAMVLSGNIDSLIDFFSFTAWIFYGGAMLALLVMRRTRPNHPRPYKCPLVIPVLVLGISAYLIVAPIIDKPQIEYLYAAGFIFAGMLVYLPFVKYGYVPKFMEGVNVFLQMLLEVAPTAAAFD
ncbi:b(0,+)-type amino acid transporter 1 isoform X1 [Megalopta genalis]|uniref:b(0,+)-type amino acid transporter 1 isoform X1 n=1 Tax=Megalopta genalis TaxID=115081 RepID=UPI0014436BB6|nr:b(0,+)-type amino acid transporter 1 isoform X1 [Megalopta genalis]XP_033328008.1 b(0,+)-type amino acid transporter 1 isoform X1 [Megalopta genalis]XP_033328016.1 b(0,+)-type amino acid transporter 1 isoform X1 [Megalopta genalis]